MRGAEGTKYFVQEKVGQNAMRLWGGVLFESYQLSELFGGVPDSRLPGEKVPCRNDTRESRSGAYFKYRCLYKVKYLKYCGIGTLYFLQV